MKRYFVYLLFFFLSGSYYSGKCAQTRTDSLINVSITSKVDTTRIKALVALAYDFSVTNIDSAIMFANKGYLLAKKIKNKKFTAIALSELGWDYYEKGNYKKALKCYFESLKIDTELKNKKGLSKTYGYIGNVYNMQGDYSRSLEYYFKSLKLKEALGHKQGIAADLSNIGVVYMNEADLEKALYYYNKALTIYESLENKNGIAITMGNIGIIYRMKKEYSKALSFYLKRKELDEGSGNKIAMAINLGNIGIVYMSQGDSAIQKGNKQAAFKTFYPKAFEYYFEALKLNTQQDDKTYITINLGNIGSLYSKTGDFAKAEQFLKRSLAVANEIGSLDDIKTGHENLSQLYDTTGKHVLALEHYKAFIEARDSLTNDENTKAQAQTEMQYEFDKKQAADSIVTAERSKQEQLKHDQEIAHQKMYTYGGIVLFAIMLIVAFVSFSAFRNKQKANLIIEQQKLLVEAKQKEIIDSIHYAKRIQLALLPSEKYITRHLNKK